MRQKAGAGRVIGIEELVRAAHRVLLAVEKALLVFRRQKRRLMMVEPPCDLRRSRVLEVDDGVLIAAEFALVKQRAGAMHQPVILIPGIAESMHSRWKRVNSEAEQAPSKHLS